MTFDGVELPFPRDPERGPVVNLGAVIVDGRFRGVHMREARAALTEAGLDPTQTLQALRRRGRLRANHGLGFRTDRKGLGKLDLCMVSA